MAFAQLLHAAGESSDGKLSPGTYAVALAADSQLELERTARRLEEHGVPFHRVIESHGQYAGQLMALGIEPGPKSVRGRYLSNMPLLSMGGFMEFKMRQAAAQTAHQAQVDAVRQVNEKKLKHYIRLHDSLLGSLLATWKAWWKLMRNNGDKK